MNSGARGRGIRGADLRSLPVVFNSLSDGAMEHFHGGDQGIIGEGLANKFHIVPGEQITLIAPRGNVTPFGTTPRVKSYTVAGTFRIGMSTYDSSFVFMPIEEAQLYFNMGNTASGLEVMIDDPDKADDMVDALQRA